jgi:hypothetical protein
MGWGAVVGVIGRGAAVGVIGATVAIGRWSGGGRVTSELESVRPSAHPVAAPLW